MRTTIVKACKAQNVSVKRFVAYTKKNRIFTHNFKNKEFNNQLVTDYAQLQSNE